MVGKICTVCKQCSVANKNLSFFIFPGDSQRRYEWLKAVDRLDLLEKLVDDKSRGNHRICEAHFLDSFIKKSSGLKNSRKCLTKDAIPSLQHVNQRYLSKESEGNISYKINRTLENNSMKMDETDKVNIQIVIEPIKTEKPDSDDECIENSVNSQFTSPELTGFHDMSQFCESVIKVCKETQTPPQELEDTRKSRKRKLDPIETNEYFLQTCSKNLPKGMLQLVKWQLNSKDNVDNYKFHMFALNLYFSGANAYDFLKDMLSLPDLDAIKKLFIPRTTKIHNGLINVLKIKVGNMSPRERICSVSIGSMQLKPNLFYNIKTDKVEGFHEIDGVQKIEPAKYALVLMVQGILEKWAQPIAHAYVANYENSPDISIWVEEVITLLIDVDLDVRAFVSDPKTELLYLLESQRVTPEKPYFSINNKNIYYIYDASQLQKTVRGFTKRYNFLIDGESPTNCMDNTGFTTTFNNLCNILSSSTYMAKNPSKKPYSESNYQKRFLKDALDMFNNLKVISKTGESEMKDVTFIKCMQISIISVVQLFNDLKKDGAKSLLTSRLSQNCLNNFFVKAKSRSKNGCSCRQFKQSFARCFVYNMLKKPKGGKGGSVHAGFNPQALLSVGKTANAAIKVGTTDYRQALPEKNKMDMVCRYLYLKCIDSHSCDAFKDYLSRSPESRMYVAPYRSSAPLDIKNCKLNPPRNFTEFIMILEKRFRDYCRQDIKISSIGHQILKKIASFEFEMPCDCFPLDYLKKLFVRLRIFYVVRENNVTFKIDKNKLFNAFSL